MKKNMKMLLFILLIIIVLIFIQKGSGRSRKSESELMPFLEPLPVMRVPSKMSINGGSKCSAQERAYLKERGMVCDDQTGGGRYRLGIKKNIKFGDEIV